MEIRILTVGKIKEKYLNDGIAEYAKRLSRYCKLNFIQVPDEKTPDKASDALNRQIKETEGNRLLSHIQEQDYRRQNAGFRRTFRPDRQIRGTGKKQHRLCDRRLPGPFRCSVKARRLQA